MLNTSSAVTVKFVELPAVIVLLVPVTVKVAAAAALTVAVCVLVNEENQRAHTFYRMCNFKMRGVYDSIFLQQTDRRGSEE